MRPSAHMDKNPSRSARSRRTGDPSRPAGPSRIGRRPARGLLRLPLLVLIPLLVGIIGGPASPVGADELSDARARQAALAKQIKNQKAEVAQINALQDDLSSEISATRRQLSGINADLASVKKSITSMGKKIDVVRKNYIAQVFRLQQLDVQLDRITVEESWMTVNLRERKAVLAERLRQAYDTDRTSMLETFLSAGSFTDVLSEVSYTIDVGEQDKALAEQIVRDQETLAAVHQSADETRAATDEMRIATAAQKVKLDKALKELKAAQQELRRLEAAPGRAPELP
jgi:peptidoglycan hydrolase CwlO-like protein